MFLFLFCWGGGGWWFEGGGGGVEGRVVEEGCSRKKHEMVKIEM